MKPFHVFLSIMLLSVCCVGEAEKTVVQGYVKDAKTGKSMAGVKVDVYPSQDHSIAVAAVETDSKGFYSVTVPPGSYYDVYLVVGDVNPNQRTTSATEAGGVYTINFNMDSESNYSNSVVDKYGVEIVIGVAALILLLIVVDQVMGRRSSKAPGASDLKRQRDQIAEMINLAKGKYHRREIDEESFREITRDQQERIIELESKIKALEGK